MNIRNRVARPVVKRITNHLFVAIVALGLAAQAAKAAPTPIGPSGVVNGNTPTFQWSAVNGASHYRLFIRNTANNQAVFDQWLTSTSYRPGALSAGTYQFYVMAFVNNNYTGWSNPLQFQVGAVVAKPGIAAPQTPSGTITGANPSFTWTNAGGATHYRLYVQNLTGGYVEVDQWVQGTSLTLQRQLAPGHQFRFYVLAFGNGQYGEWSAPKDFRVQPTREVAAQPISPNGVQTGARPLFKWTNAPEAVYYRLLVHHIDSGNNQVNRQVIGADQYQSPYDLPRGKYTWTVETYYNIQGTIRGVNSGTATFFVQ